MKKKNKKLKISNANMTLKNKIKQKLVLTAEEKLLKQKQIEQQEALDDELK